MVRVGTATPEYADCAMYFTLLVKPRPFTTDRTVVLLPKIFKVVQVFVLGTQGVKARIYTQYFEVMLEDKQRLSPVFAVSSDSPGTPPGR